MSLGEEQRETHFLSLFPSIKYLSAVRYIVSLLADSKEKIKRNTLKEARGSISLRKVSSKSSKSTSACCLYLCLSETFELVCVRQTSASEVFSRVQFSLELVDLDFVCVTALLICHRLNRNVCLTWIQPVAAYHCRTVSTVETLCLLQMGSRHRLRAATVQSVTPPTCRAGTLLERTTSPSWRRRSWSTASLTCSEQVSDPFNDFVIVFVCLSLVFM